MADDDKTHSWAQEPEDEGTMEDLSLEDQRAMAEAAEASLAQRMEVLSQPTADRPPINVDLSMLTLDLLVEFLLPEGTEERERFRMARCAMAHDFLDHVEKQVAEQAVKSRLTLPGQPGPGPMPGGPLRRS